MEHKEIDCVQDKRIGNTEKDMALVMEALFGNEKLGTKGMVRQNEEMYAVIVTTTTLKKAGIWIFTSISGIVVLIVGILHIINEWKNGSK